MKNSMELLNKIEWRLNFHNFIKHGVILARYLYGVWMQNEVSFAVAIDVWDLNSSMAQNSDYKYA